MGEIIDTNNAVKFPRVYGRRGDDRGVLVTFTFTQSVEFGAAELVGLSNSAIIERARELVASQYDGHSVSGLSGCGGASLLLSDADADLDNVLVIELGGE